MRETELVSYFLQEKYKQKQDPYRIFCARLQHGFMNGNNYVFTVHLTCYRNDRIVQLTCQATIVKHDHVLSYIRVSDRQQSPLREEINQLLESSSRTCALGRSGKELVVEDASRKSSVHRIDMVESAEMDLGSERR